MSDTPGFAYADLWQERPFVSVANLTRADGEAFLPLAAEVGIRTEVVTTRSRTPPRPSTTLCGGRQQGAAVLVP